MIAVVQVQRNLTEYIAKFVVRCANFLYSNKS